MDDLNYGALSPRDERSRAAKLAHVRRLQRIAAANHEDMTSALTCQLDQSLDDELREEARRTAIGWQHLSAHSSAVARARLLSLL